MPPNICNTVIAAISNLSTAYNLANIGLALILLDANGHRISDVQKSVLSSVVFAGAITGQLSFGYIGDCLGRGPAMQLTMALTMMGSFLSSTAVSPDRLSTDTLATQLYAWRFVLGVGVGGVYPLAATVAAESTVSAKHKGRYTSLVASTQGLGQMVVPLSALAAWHLIAQADGASTGGNLAWRVLLGVGCVPGLVIAPFRVTGSSNSRDGSSSSSDRPESLWSNMGEAEPAFKGQLPKPPHVPESAAEILRREWRTLVPRLVGAAGTWFLFDLTFYANALFAPAVLSACLRPSELHLEPGADGGEGAEWVPAATPAPTPYSYDLPHDRVVDEACYLTLLIYSIGMPGYLMAILFMDTLGARLVQAIGFLGMAFFFGVLSLRWGKLDAPLLLVVYGATFFFSNFGPNTTTKVIPAEMFPQEVRSSLIGVCAACGKLGALLGSFAFPILAARAGYRAVFTCCALIAFAGALLTWAFIAGEEPELPPSVSRLPTMDPEGGRRDYRKSVSGDDHTIATNRTSVPTPRKMKRRQSVGSVATSFYIPH